jgi:hypothetical protein
MNRYASFKVFSLLFGVVYMGLFWLNEFYGIAFLRYYPVLGGFYNVRQPPETAGPAILWYFWLFGAMAVSLAASLVVPRKWAERIPHNLVWLVSAALFLAIFVYERRWFY